MAICGLVIMRQKVVFSFNVYEFSVMIYQTVHHLNMLTVNMYLVRFRNYLVARLIHWH